MRVLQDLVLLSLLLLSISKVYSQEDKKTKELFNSGGYISDGYALDRNQVRFNQSSDFVFHYIPGGDRLTCITSKQVRDYNRHYNCILSKDSNFIAYVSVPPIFCGDKDSIYADFSFKTGFMSSLSYPRTSSPVTVSTNYLLSSKLFCCPRISLIYTNHFQWEKWRPVRSH